MTREEASPNTIMLVCEWVLKKRWEIVLQIISEIRRDSGKDPEYYPKKNPTKDFGYIQVLWPIPAGDLRGVTHTNLCAHYVKWLMPLRFLVYLQAHIHHGKIEFWLENHHAIKTLHGGQFTFSTQLITLNNNYPILFPTVLPDKVKLHKA